MARRQRPKPWARIGFIAAVLVAMFATIIATGYSPRLALDLAGGTTVTLQPRECANGSTPPKDVLDKARDIIDQRVNSLGVAEAEVAVQGNYIDVSVPGANRTQVLSTIGSTAELRFRKVLSQGFYSLAQVTAAAASQSAAAASDTASPSTSGTAVPDASGSASAAPTTTSSTTTVVVPSGASVASSTASPQGRVLTGALAAGTPTPSTSSTTTPAAAATAPSTTATTTATTASVAPVADPSASPTATAPAANACTPQAPSTATGTPSPTGASTATGTATPSGSAAAAVTGTATASPQGRVVTGALAAGTPTPSTSAPTATTSPSAGSSPTAAAVAPEPSTSTAPAPVALPIIDGATVDTACADATAAAATDPNGAAQCTAAFTAYQTLDCSAADASSIITSFAATDYAVGCADPKVNGQVVRYFLAPAAVLGTDVDSATSGPQISSTGTSQFNTGKYEIDLTFKNDKFSNFTAANVNSQFAIVLDGLVDSAPTIQQAINGSASITGNFTADSAKALASTLKFGALPISFDNNATATTISPTLGKQQLSSGLLAGAIGLFLVLVYSFVYYRAMGIITVLSLTVSGGLVYGSVVLLGHAIGFTLSLAGIAGFIVSIGITADSFVVYYERIKDELKEGRTARSAVDRAWVAARRTILSADTVSLLASVVLYFTAIGSVRGFAFTLGLSTVLDLVVVFLFTKPLIGIAIQYPLFSNSRYSGLHVARNATSGGPRRSTGTPTTKEA